MRFTVEIPKVVAEDDRHSTTVEADTVEEAVSLAWSFFQDYSGAIPPVGSRFIVTTRVEVAPKPTIPLKSF